MPHIAPYGSWKSPITSDLIVAEATGLGQIAVDGNDVYWVEMRPNESGRNVIVRHALGGHTTDMTPSPFDARTRVHEYGGGAFAVDDGVIYFSNFEDQRLYRQDPGQPPRPITPVKDVRYADGIIDRRRGHIICIREDHTMVGREPRNTLVCLSINGAEQSQILAAGNDFYSSPRLSPDGSRLAWLTWNHPNMPWDGTELWVAPVEADGALGPATRVAGSTDESLFQPEWSPDGSLYFISDRTGWWNLYRWRLDQIEPVTQMEVEFGKPQWVFGTSSYGFATARRIICSYRHQGAWYLASLDTVSKQLEPIPIPYSEMDRGDLKVTAGHVVFGAGSPSTSMSIVLLDLASHRLEVLRRSGQVEIDIGYLSTPRTLQFPTEHGLTAHAFYYPPHNRDYAAPPSTAPPLLVKCHGGPTGAADTCLDLQILYWTCRVIAVLDVIYGGSVGYG